MRTLSTLQDWLIWDEGIKLTVYRDIYGNETCGIGHNITANGLPKDVIASIPEGDVAKLHTQGLSLNEALALFNYDVLQAKYALYDARIILDFSARSAALTNMMFNLGGTRFGEFAQFISLVEMGAWHRASQDLHQNPKLFIGGLAERYNRIANVLETGTWPSI